MPPRAIAAAVRATTASTAASLVRSYPRNSASSRADGGNLGAPPKPPKRTSSAGRIAAIAVSHSAMSTPGPSGSRPDIACSCPVILDAASSTSSRRRSQASRTAESSCRKPCLG
ncbi:Uncharacterised protein [Mycobacteroides abscessus subsp. abscessus]|nr:Uncharacterised protein [Mycobacteroides abscessus subsp. abscessus]SKU92042.1 Uncharacterised protein [Mycobacteroides abscessus subsp. abscessus]